MRKVVFLVLVGISCFYAAQAQVVVSPSDGLWEQFTAYSKANPHNLLFVHTDKTIYTNNEQIWFSGYLLKSESARPEDHTILSIALLGEDSRSIYLQDKYAMEKGLGFGSLALPDTIPPGRYQLMAYTNIVTADQRPVAFFAQSLIIKSRTRPDFDVQLALLDSLPDKGSVRVKVTIEFNGNEPLASVRPRIRYHVGKNSVKTARFDSRNSCILTIPQEDLRQPEPVLLTSVNKGAEVRHLSIKLPEVKERGLKIRFFPEGGNLVSGLQNTVAWEARTASDVPIALTGILYRNDVPVDTISTTGFGIGRFSFLPEHSSTYRVVIQDGDSFPKDTSYVLPAVLPEGVVLQVTDAVVSDTVIVSLAGTSRQKVQVLLHDYREIYTSFMVDVQPVAKRIRVALPGVPRGLITLTVLDEKGRAFAERLFFAHFDQRVNATFDKAGQQFKKREKVTLALKIRDSGGGGLPGIVSVACVQDNRLDQFRQQDIESYSYLTSQLSPLPVNPSGAGVMEKTYLNEVLLVKGWRRYTWPGLVSQPVKEPSPEVHSSEFKSYVLYNNRALKKPVSVSVLRDSRLDLIETDASGNFQLLPEHLHTPVGRKVFMMVSSKNNLGYSVEIKDPFREINRRQATEMDIPRYELGEQKQHSSQFQLSGLDNTVQLQEVVVKGRKDVSVESFTGPNACGDFVCMYNILNCMNHYGHTSNTQPVKGRRYADGIIYSGCRVYEHRTTWQVDGIYTAREFYGVDEKVFDFPDPQLLSTLYWKPGVVIGDRGEAEFTFYTGDIAGRFRIVVQGVGNKDLIFGEAEFEVQ